MDRLRVFLGRAPRAAALRRIGVGALALAIGVVTACSSSPPEADLVLWGGTLIDGTGAAPVPDAVIAIRDGRIAALGAEARGMPARETLDATGRWIVPGFVDAHIHFQEAGGLYTRPDMYDLTAVVPHEEERAAIVGSIEDTLARFVCAGVTTAIEVAGPSWSFEVRDLARSRRATPAVYIAGPFLATGPIAEIWSPEDPSIEPLETVEQARSAARRDLERGVDLVKNGYVEGGDLGLFGEIVRALAEEVDRGGVRLYTHALDLPEAKVAVRAGTDTLAHGVMFSAVDDEFLALARDAGVTYTATLTVFSGYAEVLTATREPLPVERRCGDPRSLASWDDMESIPADLQPPLPEWVAAAPQIEATALTNLLRVHEAGIPIAVGSDAGNIGSLHGAGFHRELIAMAEAGVAPMDILVAATRNGARTLSETPDFGTLELGKRADLLILAADPLADIRNAQAIERVVRNGIAFTPDTLVDVEPANISSPPRRDRID